MLPAPGSICPSIRRRHHVEDEGRVQEDVAVALLHRYLLIRQDVKEQERVLEHPRAHATS